MDRGRVAHGHQLAYPFMALAIVLVLALSPLVFGEQVPVIRWFGVLIVCIGLWWRRADDVPRAGGQRLKERHHVVESVHGRCCLYGCGLVAGGQAVPGTST